MAKKSNLYQSLMGQLKALNKDTEYSRKKIDEYIASDRIVKKLTADINKRGAMIQEPNCRGDLVWKPNPAVKARQQEIATMKSILELFGLHNPVRPKTEDDYL